MLWVIFYRKVLNCSIKFLLLISIFKISISFRISFCSLSCMEVCLLCLGYLISRHRIVYRILYNPGSFCFCKVTGDVLSFLILVICIFFPLFSVSLAKGLPFCRSSQRTNFWFSLLLCILYFIYPATFISHLALDLPDAYFYISESSGLDYKWKNFSLFLVSIYDSISSPLPLLSLLFPHSAVLCVYVSSVHLTMCSLRSCSPWVTPVCP